MRRAASVRFFVELLAMCGFLGTGCPSGDAAWQVRASDDNNWLLAVAPLAGKVVAVGGQPGSAPGKQGTGGVMITPDDISADVQHLSSPQPGMLWWISAPTLGGDVAWLCGEGGSVIRYAESPGAPAELLPIPTATRATLYGIWAFDDSEVWAVGGDEGSPGVILHGDRNGLNIDTTAPRVPVLYKIFATDRDHLFAVGATGTLLRRVGTSWMLDSSPTTDRLLTVWGTSSTNIYTVGGLGTGTLVAFDGQSWTLDSAIAGFSALSGLHVTADDFLIAGQRGFVARRGSGSGPFTTAPAVTDLDLHGALSHSGIRYAVGGNLSEYLLRPPRGVLIQQGTP